MAFELDIDVTCSTYVMPATPVDCANFLRALADRIEIDEGNIVLLGLWNTGFGALDEFVFQVIIEKDEDGSKSQRVRDVLNKEVQSDER